MAEPVLHRSKAPLAQLRKAGPRTHPPPRRAPPPAPPSSSARASRPPSPSSPLSPRCPPPRSRPAASPPSPRPRRRSPSHRRRRRHGPARGPGARAGHRRHGPCSPNTTTSTPSRCCRVTTIPPGASSGPRSRSLLPPNPLPPGGRPDRALPLPCRTDARTGDGPMSGDGPEAMGAHGGPVRQSGVEIRAVRVGRYEAWNEAWSGRRRLERQPAVQ